MTKIFDIYYLWFRYVTLIKFVIIMYGLCLEVLTDRVIYDSYLESTGYLRFGQWNFPGTVMNYFFNVHGHNLTEMFAVLGYISVLRFSRGRKHYHPSVSFINNKTPKITKWLEYHINDFCQIVIHTFQRIQKRYIE